MSILTRIFQRRGRHADLIPEWDDSYDPGYADRLEDEHMAQIRAEQATVTMPAPVPAYSPEIREAAAAIVAQAAAETAQAAAQAWQQADPIVSLPVAPPPPMPPADLSRAMVSQIPDPPVNDRNFGWTHEYADYMRRVGVATGTSTELEHTMAWGVPALPPGDRTGTRL